MMHYTLVEIVGHVIRLSLKIDYFSWMQTREAFLWIVKTQKEMHEKYIESIT